jgi:lysine 2,3-aminomutase
VFILVTNVCAAYCRYCTRSRLVSNAQGYDFHPNFENALKYIEEHTEIRDVLLERRGPAAAVGQEAGLSAWAAAPDQACGIHPHRLADSGFHAPAGDAGAAGCLSAAWPGLDEHSRESSEANARKSLYEATEKLTMAGVPLGNQSVLLRGINDDVQTMASLVHRLLMMRVRPYYLYQCDLITGSRHLRADVRKGIEIMKALRGYTTGYAVPQFVIDAPGGGGKIPDESGVRE